MAIVFTPYDGSNSDTLATAIAGSGITILGTEFTGDVGQVSFFSGAGALGLSSGVLFTSGDGTPPLTNTMTSYGNAVGPFEGDGDAELTAVLQASGVTAFAGLETNDAAYLTIDFRAAAGASAVKFNLVFGSDEYPEFANSFVDIAGVFVDGTNYALFGGPGTPLSVLQSNIDAGYFIDNSAGGLGIEYDGVSHLLTIVAPLNPGLTNHTIKIAIADTGDEIYDSGIFVSGLTTDSASDGGVKQIVKGTSGNDTMAGTDAAEYFQLAAGDDSCNAGGGDDVLNGSGGNDILSGGDGADQLDGGAGNDVMNGGLDEDTLSYGSATAAVTVSLALASAQATGGAGSDTLSNLENLLGGKYNDKLTGSGGANLINGGAGNDKLTGGGGSDILIGSAGGDVLNGGGGHDTLRGDLGTDTFQFTGTPANANSDVISDFKSAQGDHIDLKIAGLGPVGTLNGALFAHGAGMVAAPSAGVHVFYDDTSGKLYYDADGSGGASAPVLMAKLTGHPTLTASDIHVI